MQIRTELQPGDIGNIIMLHGVLYAREYHLDHTFEGHVAAGLGEFAKTYDELKDKLWLAEDAGQLMGSIAINGREDTSAQLRWFLVHPETRGQGLGQTLLREALAFCRERGYRSVFLWTISELETAAHLYRKAGFVVTEENTHELWGDIRTEVRYDLTFEN